MTDGVATHAPVPFSTAPEPRPLVELPLRRSIVSDVDASAVAPELPKRNFVNLTSIEEDALGEEIEVLWELEPGAHVIELAARERNPRSPGRARPCRRACDDFEDRDRRAFDECL